MNSQEFETAVQGRVLNPKSTLQFSSILFQREYFPEDMAKLLNTLGNSSQYLDKQKNGAGIWKYSTNTLTGGYVFCIVNDNPQKTGEEGGSMEMPEWLVNICMHAVSGFLIGFSAAFVAQPAPTLPELGVAIYGAAVMGLYGALKEVAAYVETLVKKPTTKAGAVNAPKTLVSKML